MYTARCIPQLLSSRVYEGAAVMGYFHLDIFVSLLDDPT